MSTTDSYAKCPVAQTPRVLRQVCRASEKTVMDYAGRTVKVTDRRTGEIHEAKVFVAVLAALNHTFVDVTLTRSLPD